MKLKKIPGWPGAGIAKSGVIYRSRGVRATTGMAGSKRQYIYVRLYLNGKLVTVGAHVIVCLAYHGKKPSPKHHAAHINGMPADNRPSNLMWKTPSENSADKVRHGTVSCGENHVNSKLTKSDVLRIRKRTAAGENQRDIASDFGCSQCHVSDIHRRVRWGWLS